MKWILEKQLVKDPTKILRKIDISKDISFSLSASVADQQLYL